MSHPDPHHDQENERMDDDLLRQEDEARRLEDAQTVQDEMQRAWPHPDAIAKFIADSIGSVPNTGRYTPQGFDWQYSDRYNSDRETNTRNWND